MLPTIEETYRERLKMLVSEYGSQAKLSEVIDKSAIQISQWINGTPSSTGKPRSLKADTAREIERLTNKPRGWLDQPIYADKIQNNFFGNGNTQNNVSGNQLTNNFWHTDLAMAEASPKEQPDNFLTDMPLLGIDDGVEYALNPQEKGSEIKDMAQRVATFIPHSDRTFAVKIADDNLKEISQQAIQVNDILIVEPRIAPRDQDLVLVCVDYQEPMQRGLFARLSVDLQGNYAIKYCANNAEKLPENALICGVVVEIKRRLLANYLVRSRIDADWDILNTLQKGSKK